MAFCLRQGHEKEMSFPTLLSPSSLQFWSWFLVLTLPGPFHGASPVAQWLKKKKKKKNLPTNAGDPGSIPGSGRGEGDGCLRQYSCLENPMDRRSWGATVHRVMRVRHDWVAGTVPLPRRSSQEQDKGNFRDGVDSGVCELRPCHGGCRSFQNTQGALGPPGHLFLNPVEWTSFLVSKGYKGTASFSLSCRVSSSQVNPSHPGVTLAAPCSRPPECEGLSVCPPSQWPFSSSEWARLVAAWRGSGNALVSLG